MSRICLVSYGNSEIIINATVIYDKKIVIVGNDIATYTDEKGIIYMGLFQFLLSSLSSN